MKRPPVRRASPLGARGIPELLEARLLLTGDPVAADDAYQVVAGQTLVANGLGDVKLGLIHRWTFDETSGDIAHDVVGGDDGALLNWAPTEERWVPGKVGGALAWLDDADVVSTPLGDDLQQYTFSFWSYSTGLTLDNPRVITPVAAYTEAGLGIGSFGVYAPRTLLRNVWEQYSVTIDRQTSQVQVYQDGVLVAAGHGAMDPINYPWHIGHQGLDNPRGTWRGLLDDVRIYNRVISADEARVLAGKLDPQASGVLENDQSPNAVPLQASVVQNVEHGTLALGPDGTFTYTPNPGFTGVETFTYQAIAGGPETDQATVTITVAPAPLAPVAAADSYNVDPGTQLSALAAGDVSQDSCIVGRSTKPTAAWPTTSCPATKEPLLGYAARCRSVGERPAGARWPGWATTTP
ncbi:MAG: Ig-like domain-containing protein [Pirellulales bacterium]